MRTGAPSPQLQSNLLQRRRQRRQQRLRQRRLPRRLLLETLHPRHMLAGDLWAEVRSLELLHDTGTSDSDRVSANLTVSGFVAGAWTDHQAIVQFAHDGQVDESAQIDGSVMLDQGAANHEGHHFIYDPRATDQRLWDHAGPLTISYRVRIEDARGAVVFVGAWNEFSMQAEPLPSATWQIKRVALQQDTGSSTTDFVTWNPALIVDVALPEQPSGSNDDGNSNASGGSGGNEPGSASGDGSGDDQSSGTGDGGGLAAGDTLEGGGATGGSPAAPPGKPILPPGPNEPLQLLTGVTNLSSHVAVEWDWNADDVVDDRVWLNGESSLRYTPPLTTYGEREIRSRIFQWDFDNAGPRHTEWNATSLIYVAAPAPNITSLTLAVDDGPDPKDGITSDPTIAGRIDRAAADVTIYVDVNADDIADGHAFPSADGSFHFRALELEPGRHTLTFRASRWDVLADAEVFGDWQPITIVFQPRPVPQIASITAEYVEVVAEQSTEVLHGRVATDDNSATDEVPLFVEFDSDGDGAAESSVVVDERGDFYYWLEPQASGQHTLRARSVQWRSLENAYRRGEWQSFDVTLRGSSSIEPDIHDLTWHGNQADHSAPPLLTGALTSGSVQQAHWMWADIDVNGDQIVDAQVAATDDGRWHYLLPATDWADVSVAVRAAAWDEARQQIVFGPWHSVFRRYAEQLPVTPQVQALALVADTGSDRNDLRTATAVVGGTIVGGNTDRVWIELDTNGDGDGDLVQLADDQGRFQFSPTSPPFGLVTYAARAWTWNDDEYLAGDWSQLTFEYTPAEGLAPSLEHLRLVDALDAPLATSDSVPTIAGRVMHEQFLGGLQIEVDVDGDGHRDDATTTNNAGEFHIAARGVLPGPTTIHLRATSTSSDGTVLFGAWTPFHFQWQRAQPASIGGNLQTVVEITDLHLTHDTGNSAHDRSTADARISGQVQLVDFEPLPQIEFDLNQDGRRDGVVNVAEDGTFQYSPPGLSPGLVTVAARPIAVAASPANEWRVLRFVLAEDPDAPEAQAVAIPLRDYETQRETAVARFQHASQQAREELRSALQAAVDTRNAQHAQQVTSDAEVIRSAQAALHAELAAAERRYEQALRDAAAELSADLSTFAGDTASLDDWSDPAWPAAPPHAVTRRPLLSDHAPPSRLIENATPLSSDHRPSRRPLAQQAVVAGWIAAEADGIAAWSQAALQRAESQGTANRKLQRQRETAGRDLVRRMAVADMHRSRALREHLARHDVVLAELAYRQALQAAHHVNRWSLQQSAKELNDTVERLSVTRDNTVRAAHDTYQREMQAINDYYAQNPPHSQEDYDAWIRQELQWRITAYSNLETSIADANQLITTGTAAAMHRRDMLDVDARRTLELAMAEATRTLHRSLLDVSNQQQTREMETWLNWQTASVVAKHEADMQLASAQRDHAIAEAHSDHEKQLTRAEIDLQRAVQQAAALRTSDCRPACGPAAWPAVDYALEIAEFQAQHDEQLGAAVADHRRQRADAELAHQHAVTAAEWQKSHDDAAAQHQQAAAIAGLEHRRARDILDAAYQEELTRIDQQHTLAITLADSRRVYGRGIAGAELLRAGQMAAVDYDYHLEKRDIIIRSMQGGQSESQQQAEAAAARRRFHRESSVVQQFNQSRLTALADWSQAGTNAKHHLRVAGYQAGEFRANATTAANAWQLQQQVVVDKSLAIALQTANGQWRQATMTADADLAVSATQLDGQLNQQQWQLFATLQQQEAAANSRLLIREAESQVTHVQTWAALPSTPAAWGEAHVKLATADRNRVRSFRSAHERWLTSYFAGQIDVQSQHAARDLQVLTQQVQAAATLVQSLHDADARFVQEESAAAVAAADTAATVVQTYEVEIADADQSYLVTASGAVRDHELNASDAQTAYYRRWVDAYADLAREVISDAQFHVQLQAARDQHQVADRAADVTLISAVATARETWAGAAARADESKTVALGRTSFDATTSVSQAEERAARRELAAWKLVNDTLDHLVAWKDREAVRAAGKWKQQFAAADAAFSLSVTAADEALRETQQLAESGLQFSVAQQQADSMAEQNNGNSNQRLGTLMSAVLSYQADVAAADAMFAGQQHAAELSLQQEISFANQNLAGELLIAESDWVGNLVTAEQEHVDRLTAAIVARGQQSRDASSQWQQQELSAATVMQRTVAAVLRDMLRDMAQQQTAFEIAEAAAEHQWTIAAAKARANLQLAGGNIASAWTKDEAQRSDAEHNYVQAMTAAAAHYNTAHKLAATARATAWGNALVAFYTQQGQAGVARAQHMANQSSHFAAVNGGIEVSYAIGATEAARRHVETIAGGETALELAVAVAHQKWIHALGVAEKNHATSAGNAHQLRRTQHAHAEWKYHVAALGISTSWNEAQRTRHDWLHTAGPDFVQYQGQLAAADSQLAIQQAGITADKENALAAAHTQFVIDKHALQADFVRNEIAAVNNFHMLVVDADNLLLAQLADADGRRDTGAAQYLADHDVALAVATRDHAIDVAALNLGQSTSAADDRRRLATAQATRDLDVGWAGSDHQWHVAAVAAEEWHTQFITSHARVLDQSLSANHAKLMRDSGPLVEQWVNNRAAVEVQHAKHLQQAFADWQQSQSAGTARWETAQWSAAVAAYQNLAARTAWPWAQYQARRAAAMQQWSQQQQLSQPQASAAANAIDAQFVTDVGLAYQTYAAATTAAHTTWVTRNADSQQGRRDALADSRHLLAGQLIPAAKVADLTRGHAQFTYRVAMADAVLAMEHHQHQPTFDAAVLTASTTYHSTVAAAQQQFDVQRQHAEADDQQRRQNADAAFHLDRLATDEQWRLDRALADADWEDALARALADRQQGLEILGAQQSTNIAGAVDQVFQQLLADNDSPWAAHEAAVRRAAAEHQQQQTTALIPWIQARTEQQLLSRTASGTADRHMLLSGKQAADQYRQALQEQARDLSDAQRSASRDAGGILQLIPDEPWRDLGLAARREHTSWIESLIYGGSLLQNMFDPRGLGLLFQLTSAGIWLSQPGPRPSIQSRVEPPARPGLPPNGMWRPGMEAERAAMEQMAQENWTVPESASRSSIRWFFDDLGLMMRHPMAAASGLPSGAKTSSKIAVNGTLSSVKSMATLGFASSPWELLEVTEDDHRNGYQPGFVVMRGSQELLVAALTGKLATPNKAGKYSTWGRRAYYVDLTQNVVSTGRGAYGVTFGEGWTLSNTVDLVGGAMGVSGNALARPSRAAKAVPEAGAEALDHGLGIGVVLSGKKDKVGHAFVVLELPDGTQRAYGFYPRFDFDMYNSDHVKRLLRLREDFLADVVNDLDNLQSPSARVAMFPVTRAQYERAMAVISDAVRQTAEGTRRYNLCSQCATFARNVLREAGLRPFIPVPYPPLMYWTMWFVRRL